MTAAISVDLVKEATDEEVCDLGWGWPDVIVFAELYCFFVFL